MCGSCQISLTMYKLGFAWIVCYFSIFCDVRVNVRFKGFTGFHNVEMSSEPDNTPDMSSFIKKMV